MKNFRIPMITAALATGIPSIGMADGSSTLLNQDMIDKAHWKKQSGKDEVTGDTVHTLYTAKLGDTHIGFSHGFGDLSVFDKRDLRVAMVAAKDDIGLDMNWPAGSKQ